MKYKGFIILPEYSVGSTFSIKAQGEIISRKPTSKDIEYYIIYDPMEGMKRWIAENSIKECKQTIDSFLRKTNMKSNHSRE